MPVVTLPLAVANRYSFDKTGPMPTAERRRIRRSAYTTREGGDGCIPSGDSPEEPEKPGNQTRQPEAPKGWTCKSTRRWKLKANLSGL
jgi:hypothetical protein